MFQSECRRGTGLRQESLQDETQTESSTQCTVALQQQLARNLIYSCAQCICSFAVCRRLEVTAVPQRDAKLTPFQQSKKGDKIHNIENLKLCVAKLQNTMSIKNALNADNTVNT